MKFNHLIERAQVQCVSLQRIVLRDRQQRHRKWCQEKGMPPLTSEQHKTFQNIKYISNLQGRIATEKVWEKTEEIIRNELKFNSPKCLLFINLIFSENSRRSMKWMKRDWVKCIEKERYIEK